MRHIYIACTKSDRWAAGLLRMKLKYYALGRRHSAQQDIVVDNNLFSTDPQDRNYLIVFCSPSCVADLAVAETIRQFRAQESSDRILLYVQKGIPHAQDTTEECLPGILGELGLNDLVTSNAFYWIISSVCDIPLEQLEQRGKRHRIVRGVVIVLLMLGIAAALVLDHFNTHRVTVYCRSIRYENAVPVGVGWLGFWPKLFCSDYYRLTVSDWRICEFTMEGTPTITASDDSDVQAYYRAINSPSVTILYSHDGSPDSALHYDEEGNLLFSIHYIGGISAADLSADLFNFVPYYLLPDAECSRCCFIYDKSGQLTDLRWYPNSRNELP